MKIDTDSLTHSTWNCKYHIVFAPKYRRQVGEKIELVSEEILKVRNEIKMCDRIAENSVSMRKQIKEVMERQSIEKAYNFKKKIEKHVR